MQLSFDPLDFMDAQSITQDEAQKQALRARNLELKRRRANGEKAIGFALRGQLRPYASFGVPDGRVRTVYYVQL